MAPASSTGGGRRTLPDVALLIDTPRWPAHGRLWAHLISDTSLTELHAFAEGAGVPRRSFEGDHYDVPAERHAELVAAGARLVEGRDIIEALRRSGLRLPKRKGERVLASWPQASWNRDAPAQRVDCIASPLIPVGDPVASWLIELDGEGRLTVDDDRLPTASGDEPRLGYLRLRPARHDDRWRHVALHWAHGRGLSPQDGRHRASGYDHLPLQQVTGVLAQELWWPLLLNARSEVARR